VTAVVEKRAAMVGGRSRRVQSGGISIKPAMASPRIENTACPQTGDAIAGFMPPLA
jgi:hypothetical protein